MKIEAFILCWNEQDILPFVIKHYQKFCDKITILDNYSSDNSPQIAKDMGCEVKQFGNKYFDDSENMKVKNNCWKGTDADWVIVCDCDEVLILPTVYENGAQTRYYLGLQSNATIFKTIGWQIMSDSMPKEDLLEITNGYRFDNYSKNIIFNPKAIQEINYNPGAHKINPVGNVVYSDEALFVFHYKHIGGIERTIKRYKEYQPRMSPINRKKGWGIHYNRSVKSLREEWNERMDKSKPLI